MIIGILGCGPTGLAAAQACVLAGHKVEIYSRRTRSALYGAQYLHEPIPGLASSDTSCKVAYQLKGSIEGYRRKVYGADFDGNVSPDHYEGEHEAWDIRAAYAELWEKFFNDIRDIQKIDPHFVRNMVQAERYGMVINSIPRSQLCSNWTHQFDFQEVWAMGDAPGLQSVPFECPEDTVLCSGDSSDPWYRISNVYGYRTVEFRDKGRRPMWQGRPIPATKTSKPLSTNCDCLPGLLHIGRFGMWKKGVLVSDAYRDVKGWLDDLS